MITQFLIGMATQFAGWIGTLFPAWSPPTQLVNMAQGVSSVLNGMAGFGVWVDFTTLSACVITQITTWVIVLGVKLVRAIIAHVPQFGGAGD